MPTMKTLFAKLLGLTTSIFNFYLPILKQLIASGTAALLPIALEFVRGLGDSDIPSSQKFDIALANLKEAAIREGILASESILRYTVESAVQKWKSEG